MFAREMRDGELNVCDAMAARFEAAALPYLDSLYHKAMVLTRRPEDASDLVQETFLRAYRSFDSFTEGTNCKAWLFTIQYSIFVNQYRKARREPEKVSFDEFDEGFDRLLADEPWTDACTALAEPTLDWTSPEVRAALEKLPETFRMAVLLVDVEGLTYEEASGVVVCPVGTLRSRLFRARRILFVELQDYARRMGLIRRQHA
jgi:RNA polymerase sigma-70 factor (ECF subfamily)